MLGQAVSKKDTPPAGTQFEREFEMLLSGRFHDTPQACLSTIDYSFLLPPDQEVAVTQTCKPRWLIELPSPTAGLARSCSRMKEVNTHVALGRH